MTSVRGVAAAGITLAAIPLALLGAAAGADPEILLHLLLGVGFLATATAVFDFDVTRWLRWAGALSMGALGVIFALQGVADALSNAPLQGLAYDVLGQELERVLPDVFIAWCVGAVVQHSRGRTRWFGAFALAVVIAIEVADYTGAELPAISKAALLLPFAWLLVESNKPRSR
jgi:hypothetical protein